MCIVVAIMTSVQSINHVNKMMYACIVLYVLTFTDFDYPFGILKYFLNSNGETGYDCYEKKA
jgi:hypothetical protein